MRILALDATLARCSAAAVEDDRTRAEAIVDADRGQAAVLPGLVAAVLAEAGWDAGALELIAVTVGPGSFTGIRAALSLALGIGFAAGVPVAGVTVGEALAAAAGPLAGRELWSAIDSKRGRVFIERGGVVAACAPDALPVAAGPVAVAGDAAPEIAARLAVLGADVRLTDLRLPGAAMAAVAARTAARAGTAFRPPQPLYVDGPQTKPPAQPARPPPGPR